MLFFIDLPIATQLFILHALYVSFLFRSSDIDLVAFIKMLLRVPVFVYVRLEEGILCVTTKICFSESCSSQCVLFTGV